MTMTPATSTRIDALAAMVESLRTVPRPSRKLHRELQRTRSRLRVWRKKLEATP
jgi:hypothetical protein